MPPIPLGVIRFRKLQASWVSTVGTKGRSLLTQPMSAVAHAIGMSGYRTSARTAQPQVAFSNWLWTVAQSTPSRLGIAIASASRMPASIPMLTRREALDLERRDVFGTGGGRRGRREAALSVLLRCFSPFVSPTGSAAGCTTGITAADAVLAQRVDRGARWRARCPTSRALMTRTAASSRSSQYCSPLASAALKSSSAIDAPSPTTMRSGSRLPWLIPARWSWSTWCQIAGQDLVRHRHRVRGRRAACPTAARSRAARRRRRRRRS